MHFYCKYLVGNTFNFEVSALRYDLQMTSTSQFQDLFLKISQLLLTFVIGIFLFS